ncbi:MAG: PilZ domain-containing protein [Myxococcaceae bacterium]|nr:PilZ domain-containing protein [Myxococcaceae bacterium]
MISGRRFPRFPLNLRLRLQLATGELETTTDDVSLAGFSAPAAELPEVGTSFGFVLHLPDGTLVNGTACAMRLGAGGSAGFSCEFAPDQLATWQAFLEQEQSSGGVWRMIGRYATSSGEDQEAARSVLEKGPLGILFRRLGGEKPAPEATEPPGVMRLHMVGENGEAWRIAFEKHPSEAPEVSAFAGATPNVLEFARRTVLRVLTQDVFIKRSPRAVVEPVRLVELTRGGFGTVAPQPGGKVSLLGLHGSELIVIEVDGKPVFPFFAPDELDRIACDTLRREPDERPAAAPAPLREERFSASYEHKVVDSQRRVECTPRQLSEAMDASQRVQRRTYGTRTVRLFPDVWLEVVRPSWPGPARGFAMEDGSALCVFVMVGPHAPRVIRLESDDAVFFIRER